MLIPVFLTLHTFLGIIRVDEAGTCPSVADVVEQQKRLSASDAHESEPLWRARIEERPDGALHVRVRDIEGATRVERVLPAGGTCTTRAESLAVLLAAWESDLEAVPLAPRVQAAQPVVSAPMPPAPARAPLRPVSAPEVQPEWVGPRETTASAIQKRPVFLFVSTAAGATSQRGGVYPSLELSGTIRGEGAPIGFQFGTWLSMARGRALGPGAVSVREELFQASAVLTRERADWRAELGLGGVVAWMHLGASGFTENQAIDAFRPGLTSTLFLSRRLRATWVGAGFLGRGWLTRPRVFVDGVAPVLKLRAMEGTAAVRVGWDF